MINYEKYDVDESIFFFIWNNHSSHLSCCHSLYPFQMENARVGLQASLLVRSAETGELFVNFDPEILTQIREANCMTKMNLEIPPFAALLQQKQGTLKKNYNKLQVNITHRCTSATVLCKINCKSSNWYQIIINHFSTCSGCTSQTAFISSPFQLMLSENTRVRAKIQSAFEPLAMPHIAKVRC